MDRNYQGVIWTDHALERLKNRNIKQGDAWATFNRPDTSRKGKKKGVYVYYKTWSHTNKNGKRKHTRIEVVATKTERKEWLILSVWSKPVSAKEAVKNTKKDKSLLQSIFRAFGF